MSPGESTNRAEQGQHVQTNTPTSGGTVYANQGGDQFIYPQPTVIHNKRRAGGRAVLVILAVDVAFFFYGMLAYTGRNTSADAWRAGIFLLLLAFTGSLLRRWVRRF